MRANFFFGGFKKHKPQNSATKGRMHSKEPWEPRGITIAHRSGSKVQMREGKTPFTIDYTYPYE